MKTFNNLLELINQAENQYNSLSRIAKSEIIEYGSPKADTCRRINALIYSISNAYDIIDKGLDGEF